MLIDKVKKARRIMTDAFDDQIGDLLESGLCDLAITGANIYVERDENNAIVDADPLIREALITYVALHFGEPDDYDRLARSYTEQKAQVRCNPKYEV